MKKFNAKLVKMSIQFYFSKYQKT